jgi:hypothetical protein
MAKMKMKLFRVLFEPGDFNSDSGRQQEGSQYPRILYSSFPISQNTTN